jgi:amino acid permease
MSKSNGWRSGHDPIIRWLRTGATVAFIVVAVIVALDRERDASSLTAALGFIVGAVLILLGYASIIRLPYVGTREPEKREDDP